MKLRPRAAASAALATALTVTVLGVAPGAHADPAPAPLCSPEVGGQSGNIKLDGWVNAPATLGLADLQAKPHTSVVDSFPGFAAGQKKFTGVSLADLLGIPADGSVGSVIKADDPGPMADPNALPPVVQKNNLTRYSVMVTGSDCFQALFSGAEISSWAGLAQKPIVAWGQGNEADPAEATGQLGAAGKDGFARLIIPTDLRGSRRVSNVVGITVLKAPAETNALKSTGTCGTGGPSSSLKVNGWTTAETVYDQAGLDGPTGLKTKPHSSLTLSNGTKYTGVSLADLLGFPNSAPVAPDPANPLLPHNNNGLGTFLKPDVPGPQAPAVQKNDLTRFAVMVTGTDCFQALFSAAELSPFWAGPAQAPLLAWAQSVPSAPSLDPLTGEATGSLGASGFARIVITDALGSRRVSNVAEIRVLRAPTPEISWTPASLTYGTPLGAAQLNASATMNSAPVGGTFSYGPGAGAVLPAGQHQVVGFYTPEPGTSFTVARAKPTLTVSQAGTVTKALPLLGTLLHPTAKLTRADSGGSIAGQTVTFKVGPTTVCTAPTDASGVARCSNTIAVSLTGFTATFAGTNDYTGSTGQARLLG